MFIIQAPFGRGYGSQPFVCERFLSCMDLHVEAKQKVKKQNPFLRIHEPINDNTQRMGSLSTSLLSSYVIIALPHLSGVKKACSE